MAEGREKVCLITGASRGIGRATALALNEAGWRLSLVARSKDALVELVRETDCEHLTTVADVTSETDVIHAVQATVTELGRLDAVVCAAGTGVFVPTTEVTKASWDEQIAANLTGTFLVCREALKVMLPQNHRSRVIWSIYCPSRPKSPFLTRRRMSPVNGALMALPNPLPKRYAGTAFA
jgi:NAD(P)-dependent dehydrogenase (short-subunit alcohol dehydrogenase family)